MRIVLGTDGSRYFYLDSQCSGAALYDEFSEIFITGEKNVNGVQIVCSGKLES
jgi:hypothetical protein